MPDQQSISEPTSGPAIPLSVRLGWGSGSVAMALMFQSISILLLVYLTDHAGISAGLAGALIGLSKIYDAVTDPLMGVVSDRTRSRWGRRRPYLLAGGVVSALAFVMLFSVGQIQDETLRIWVTGLSLILYATGYTIFNVPYLTMPAEMTDDNQARSVLMSFRIAGVASGQIISTVIGPLIIFYFGGGIVGHAVMSYLVAGLILTLSVITFVMTGKAPVAARLQSSANVGLIGQVKLIWSNRPFIVLLAVKLFQLMGLAVQLSILPYIVVRVMGADYKLLSQFFLIYALVILVAQPIWVRIVVGIGKRASFILSASILAIAGMSWLLVTATEPMSLFLLRSLVLGFGAAGILLAGQAMLPDVMEYDYLKNGLRREGIFAGLYTMFEKFAFAFGPVLVGLFLSYSGYDGNLPSGQSQGESAINAIYLCASVIPFVLVAIAIGFMMNYTLTEERLRSMHR